jgi:hypothetical protein
MAIEIAPNGPEVDERFDMRAFWRLAGWGAVAAFALILVAIVSVSDAGSQRLAASAKPTELPVRPVTTIAVPPMQDSGETKRLAGQVRELAADRNQMSARIESLEHQLDDLTGSIKRLADLPPVTAPPPAPKTASANAPASASATHSPLAMPALGDATPWPVQPKLRENNEPETTEEQAAAQQPVPVPPERVAVVSEPPQPEFGIALAGASSIEVARLQWAAVKANFGSMISSLQPRAMTERRGSATHYRLVAGPLPTLTAATRLCARIVAAYAICQPVKYSGEPL